MSEVPLYATLLGLGVLVLLAQDLGPRVSPPGEYQAGEGCATGKRKAEG